MIRRRVCPCPVPYQLHSMPESRRLGWLAALKLKHPPKKVYVCSLHFVDKRPTDDHPNPELYLGYDRPVVKKRRAIVRVEATGLLELNEMEENHFTAGETSFSCSKIENNFTHKSAQRTAAENPFTCPQCGKSFKFKIYLIKHIRIHTGERPFTCPQCGKSFTFQGPLKDHIRIHTGEKSHKCSYCGKNFSRSGTLKTHERVHTGEKPYRCTSCGKTFKQSSHLQTHMKKHCPNQSSSGPTVLSE